MMELHIRAAALVTMLAATLGAPGCSGGGSARGDADADAAVDSPADGVADAADTAEAGDMAESEGDGAGPGTCAGCPGTNACIVVRVGREADTSMQPWVVWPTEADGTGTLVASASRGSDVLARETLGGAVMTPADAAYTVALCAAAGACKVRVFLDDDGDASATATSSADYLDSCMGQYGSCFRCIDVNAPAGVDTAVDVDLRGSCD